MICFQEYICLPHSNQVKKYEWDKMGSQFCFAKSVSPHRFAHEAFLFSGPYGFIFNKADCIKH